MAIITKSLDSIFKEALELRELGDIVEYNKKDVTDFLNNLKYNYVTGSEVFNILLTLINNQNIKLYTMELEKQELEKQIEIQKKTIESLNDVNKHYLHLEKVKNGESVRYKKDITVEKIIELQKKGLTQEQIAETLGITRMTVSRRLRELKALTKKEENISL